MPTTNNNWPTPVATDLVKDGWEAIKDLGDAIDTTLGVYSPATPMGVHLSTVTFSAVSSVSLSTSLLTGYKGYKVLYTFTNSGDNNPSIRVRAVSTDDTSANYGGQAIIGNDSTASAVGTGTATSWNNFGTTSGANKKTCINLELWDLNLADSTFGFVDYIRFINESSTNKVYRRTGINHNVATAYDGLTLIASTGTITGDYKVWGFNA